MKENQMFTYSGDLFEEMQEMNKTCNSMEETERGMTFTFVCTGLLTIICC